MYLFGLIYSSDVYKIVFYYIIRRLVQQVEKPNQPNIMSKIVDFKYEF